MGAHLARVGKVEGTAIYDTDGNRLTLIGYQALQVGDAIVTDGRVIFGWERRGTMPAIVGEDSYSGVPFLELSFFANKYDFGYIPLPQISYKILAKSLALPATDFNGRSLQGIVSGKTAIYRIDGLSLMTGEMHGATPVPPSDRIKDMCVDDEGNFLQCLNEPLEGMYGHAISVYRNGQRLSLANDVRYFKDRYDAINNSYLNNQGFLSFGAYGAVTVAYYQDPVVWLEQDGSYTAIISHRFVDAVGCTAYFNDPLRGDNSTAELYTLGHDGKETIKTENITLDWNIDYRVAFDYEGVVVLDGGTVTPLYEKITYHEYDSPAPSYHVPMGFVMAKDDSRFIYRYYDRTYEKEYDGGYYYWLGDVATGKITEKYMVTADDSKVGQLVNEDEDEILRYISVSDGADYEEQFSQALAAHVSLYWQYTASRGHTGKPDETTETNAGGIDVTIRGKYTFKLVCKGLNNYSCEFNGHDYGLIRDIYEKDGVYYVLTGSTASVMFTVMHKDGTDEVVGGVGTRIVECPSTVIQQAAATLKTLGGVANG